MQMIDSPVTLSLIVFILGFIYHLYNSNLRSNKVLLALILVQGVGAVVIVWLGVWMMPFSRGIYMLAGAAVTRTADIISKRILDYIVQQERKPTLKRLDRLEVKVRNGLQP